MTEGSLTPGSAFFMVLSFLVLGLIIGGIAISTSYTPQNGWTNFAGYVTSEQESSSGSILWILLVLVIGLAGLLFYVRHKTSVIQQVVEGYY